MLVAKATIRVKRGANIHVSLYYKGSAVALTSGCLPIIQTGFQTFTAQHVPTHALMRAEADRHAKCLKADALINLLDTFGSAHLPMLEYMEVRIVRLHHS